MKLRLLWFGRPSRSPYEAQVRDYCRRVGHRWQAEDLPLRPDQRGRDNDPKAALSREAKLVAARTLPNFRVVALDEGGLEMSSVQLAGQLARWEDASFSGVQFVIGSDRGLAPELIQGADLRLSLSRMTLPHLLARLFLWEQLYRASDILGSGRYHRS